jgi:hypothetical protein
MYSSSANALECFQSVFSSDEELLEEYLQFNSVYDLFKCGMCGHSWIEHDSSCMRHDKRAIFNLMRLTASKMDKYKRTFEMAKRNGYQEPAIHGILEKFPFDGKPVMVPENGILHPKYSIDDFICECDEIIP